MHLDPEYIKWELPYTEGLQYLHANLLANGHSVFYPINKQEFKAELESKLNNTTNNCAYE